MERVIVNAVQNGWEVIYQRSHANLTAMLVASWKKDEHGLRWTELIVATAQHDDQEVFWDESPHLTAKGAPLDFTQGELDTTQMQARHVIENAYRQGVWIALLISKHNSFLYEPKRGENEQLAEFLDEQAQNQEHWRDQLGYSSQKVDDAYSFLRWADRMSLILCRGDLPERDRELDVVPNKKGTMIRVKQRADSTLSLTPWPFEDEQVHVSVEPRQLHQLTFPDDEAFLSTMNNADIQIREWCFEKYAIKEIPMQRSPVSAAVKNTPELEPLGEEVKSSVKGVIMRNESTRSAADFLHGTWLGHPLHPLLTDMVVGGWTLSVFFDVLGLAATDDDFAQRAADTLLGLGLVTAVPTMLSGLADYSGIKRDSVETGIAHALANGTAFVMFLLSMWARRGNNRSIGFFLSLVGLGFLTLGAYLGGDLAYRKKVGVNHAEPVNQPTAWTDIMSADELGDDEWQRVEVVGYPVLVFRHGDTVHAVGAICSHAGGPLEEGTIQGDCVTCPWHASVFDMHDGSVVHGPAVYQQPNYLARIHEGTIQVVSA